MNGAYLTIHVLNGNKLDNNILKNSMESERNKTISGTHIHSRAHTEAVKRRDREQPHSIQIMMYS